MKNSSRRSIRYYVSVDEQLFRLRSVDHFSLIKAEQKLPRFANRSMRVIEVVVTESPEALARSLRGLIIRFASDGTLDISDAANAVAITLRSSELPDKGPNVVNMVPELERRAWDASHQWSVDQASVQQIDNDLLKKAKLPIFKLEK